MKPELLNTKQPQALNGKNKKVPSLLTAFFILFIDSFGYAIVFPSLSILLLRPSSMLFPPETLMSTRNLLLGFAIAAFPLAQFFGAPFFGDVADRFGRKRAFIFTIIGGLIGYFLSGISVLIHRYPLLLFSRVFTGFFAGNLAISLATVSDLSSSDKEKGRNFGIVAALMGLSWTLAILVGISLINPDFAGTLHPSHPFWLMSALSCVSLIILLIFFRETTPKAPKEKLDLFKGIHNILLSFESKQLGYLYLFLVFWFLGFFISIQWSTPISIERFHATSKQLMWFFSAFALIWTLSSLFVTRIFIGRVSEWYLTLWTLVIVMVMYFFVGASDYYLYYEIAYLISGAAAAIVWTTSMHLISQAASPQEQGKALGIGQSMLAFSQFFGPIFGGLLATFALGAIYYTCSGLVLVSFLILLSIIIRRNKLNGS